MEKKFFRRDVLFAVCALAVSLAALLCFSVFKKDGAYAAVIVSGNVHSRHRLAHDTVVEIATEYGKNTLKIENGRAYMVYADCPDGVCTAHGKISRAGETIVCLPNKLVVEIRDE